ncbi:MAG TPA: GlsB/YeaQ/YmgE family stress response membrane protein [Solirubrobacteraceae bacterium]|nr:GlsB/YeaQ/YmgE family stress response membrane protein [Solirubrobacteraceae bacterium]
MIGAIILGIVAGFIARALMPGKDPMGFFATILLGLAGALVGFFLFTELLGIGDNEAFDLGGLVGAILGAMILLGIYRMVAGNRHPDRAGRPAPRH